MRTIALALVATIVSPIAVVADDVGDPKLAKVVLIGDSIRLGYTPTVAKELAETAVVVSPKPNGQDSSNVLAHLEEWVIRERPAVVHFNCGIHDTKRFRETGRFQVSPEEYAANLKRIVERIRNETDAIVLFATTTPIDDDRAAAARRGRDYELLNASVERYNEIARKVMKELEVPVDDLNAALAKKVEDEESLLGTDGVHPTRDGYEKLGRQVASFVKSHLPKPTSAPNIVFILADDLGWSDLGCQGHPWHETPHLDRFAAEGLRFTNGYAPAPICSATRASLLTGRTPARLGFEFVTKDAAGRQRIVPEPPLRAPPYTLNLPLEQRTYAERLRDVGYSTAFVGKWHVNQHYERYLGWSPTHGPPRQGFDHTKETFGSHPYNKAGQQPIETRFPENDDVTRWAIDFLKRDHEKPILLVVSHYYVHTPVRVTSALLREQFDGILPTDIPNRTKRVEYAAFVATLDHLVGELLTGIDEARLPDDTLVVFTSDNGGHPEYASNRPLRGSKWNLYEGGIRVPFLVRWPGHTEPGTTCDEAVVGYDLLPTFAAVAGHPVDPLRDGLDGRSLVPVLDDRSTKLDRPLFWHFPYYHPEGTKYRDARPEIGIDDFAVSRTHPHSAIRRGPHKLLYFPETDSVELYDLTTDPGEQRNLADENPDAAASLRGELLDYLTSVEARRATPRDGAAE